MSEYTLQVAPREEHGKKISKQLRREGRLPAVYYFQGKETSRLSVDAKVFGEAFHGDANIFNIDVGDGKVVPTIIRDIQFHPVTNAVMHVDFMGVDLKKVVQVEVPVHVTGTAVGVKDGGGVLQFTLRNVAIECLPGDIPEAVDVDVTELNINDSLKVSDLTSDKVTFLTDGDSVIVSVLPPRLEVEEDEVEAAEGEEGAAEATEETEES